MSGTEPSALLEVEPGGGRAVMRAFVAWAGEDVALEALFTPDTLMAIDVPGRRGVLFDETWYVTVWIDEGAAAFRACLERELPDDQGLSSLPMTWASPVTTGRGPGGRQGSPELWAR